MTEHRSSNRLPCEFRTDYQARQDESWWWARVTDISRGGVKLKSYQPLHEGDVLTLDLSLPDLGPVRVAHVERDEPAGFRIGCAFPRELSADEFSRLQRRAKTNDESWLHRGQRSPRQVS